MEATTPVVLRKKRERERETQHSEKKVVITTMNKVILTKCSNINHL